MRKLAAAILLVLSAACASTDDLPPPSVAVPPPTPDPRIGAMQTQLTELLERIDVLNHRINRLEEGGAIPAQADSAPSVQPAPSRPSPVPQQPRRAESAPQPALISADIAGKYRDAIVLFGQGKVSDARRTFQEVYEADPQGDLADNALFWIGETWFAAKDYVNAMRFYGRVITDYGDQNKAPDAMFKTALAQERTGDLALAKRTLQQVIERYPYSSSASTAKQELQRLKY